MYVTHDQVEAMTLADRVVILNQGRIEQVGTPMEVYAAPANLFVAGFIGSPAMNMIPAEITSSCRGSRVLAAGVSLPLDPRNAMALTPGMKAVFGIRPEDIAVLPPGADAPAIDRRHGHDGGAARGGISALLRAGRARDHGEDRRPGAAEGRRPLALRAST